MFDAIEFREKFLLNLGDFSIELQAALIKEEAAEVAEAFEHLKAYDERFNLKALRAHLLKELGDLVYVCYQAAATFGWDLTEACTRIHNSNLSKLDRRGKPIYREDGKILKGPNYYEPDLRDLV